MAKLIGFGNNPKGSILLGVAASLVYILLNMLSPAVSIGFPMFFNSQMWENFMIVVIVAPIVEEIMFVGILYNTLMAIGIKNIFMVILTVAAAFSGFHWTAYGMALAAAFVGAFLFRIIVLMIDNAKDSNRSIIPGIVMHMIVNFYLLNKVANIFMMG